jgi:hypothetical protein
MNISCKENSAGCILNLHSSVLTFELVFKLQKILNEFPFDKSIALNLNDVDSICVEFLDLLKETSRKRRISLTNIQAEIFVLLNLTKYDKFAPLFLSDIDFLEQKRALINRRFSVL